MKTLLIVVSIFGIIIISGSVFYHLVIFLPELEAQKQEDIEAIRNFIAPQKEQVEKTEKTYESMLKSISERSACLAEMQRKQEEEIASRCPSGTSPDGLLMSNQQERLECMEQIRKYSKYQISSC